MSETEKQKDKKLYSYKKALSQPYWIQKFNDEFSLKNPIKFSRVAYFVFLFGFFWLVLDRIFPFLPFGLRGMLSVLGSLQLSAFLSEIEIDGKSFLAYLKDYLLFYFIHGSRAGKVYINKGQIYSRPEADIKIIKEYL